jgi:peptidyl-prolyl cis-trans isomerase A (cyclophilin A)
MGARRTTPGDEESKEPGVTRTIRIAICAILLAAVAAFPQAGRPERGKPRSSPGPVRLLIETEAGSFELDVDPVKAPITTANFLRYVDKKLYDGGQFHRSVRLDNQARKDVLIEVIQGGTDPSRLKEGFPAIDLERTSVTGLRHRDGTISMARAGTDSATSDFFICIGDQPELDFGGKRNSDRQGFAAFGKIVSGMEVVRKIHRSPTEKESESLSPPIRILSVRRKP